MMPYGFDGDLLGIGIVGAGLLVSLGNFIGVVVFMAVRAKRRGDMLTHVERDWRGVTLDEARDRLTERLMRHRFRPGGVAVDKKLTPAQRLILQDAVRILAARPKESGVLQSTQLWVATHASKEMNADFALIASGSGVTVHAWIWTPDTVIADTGEGRHIDELMQYLLHPNDMEPEPLEVVPNPSFGASLCLGSALLAAACGLAAAVGPVDIALGAGLLLGASGMGVIMVVCMALLGLKDILLRPKEMTGGRVMVAGVLVFVLAMPVCAYAYYARHTDRWEGDGPFTVIQRLGDAKPYPREPR